MPSSSTPSPPTKSAQASVYTQVRSTEDEEEAIAVAVDSDLNRKRRRKTLCCITTGICAAAWAIAVSVIMVTLLVRRDDTVSVGSPASPQTADLPVSPPSLPPTPTPMPMPSPASPTMSTITELCSTTDQPQLCVGVLAAYPAATEAALPDLTAYVVQMALDAVNKTYGLGLYLSRNSTRDADMAVLQDCLELLDGARDELAHSLERLRNLVGGGGGDGDGDGGYRARIRDVRVWLSAAYTDEDTCWDNFAEAGSQSAIAAKMSAQGQPISPLLIVALSFSQTLEERGPALYYTFSASAASASAPTPSYGPGH